MTPFAYATAPACRVTTAAVSPDVLPAAKTLPHSAECLAPDRHQVSTGRHSFTRHGSAGSVRALRTAALSLLLPLVTGVACAGPIVAPGSSYSVYLAGSASGNVLNTGPVVFDTNAAAFTRAGLALSLTENQVDHGNGRHTITIRMSSNGDLFPALGEAAWVGIGTLGTPLSFLQDVYLESGRISYFGADDLAYFTTNNLADDFRLQYFSGPWSGYFSRPDGVFANGNIGGRDTRGVSFVFDVTAIPEPHGAALAGLALLILAARRPRAGAQPARKARSSDADDLVHLHAEAPFRMA